MNWVAWYMVIWLPTFLAWGLGQQIYGIHLSKGRTPAEVNKQVQRMMFEHRYLRWLTAFVLLGTMGMFIVFGIVAGTELYGWYSTNNPFVH